ncbi:MAG: endonuclease/exonuclease/phosphatase family protein [Ferruginibacter sp.]
MKRFTAWILLLTLISGSLFAQHSLNVMTFNIRLQTDSDSLNAWPYRKDKVVSQILYNEAHIVGVQEAVPSQMDDLRLRLKNYRSVGVGRDDGKNKGEYSAIFYDTSRLTLIESETFWLSETPSAAGSKGWDAAFPRIVTWARFSDKLTGKIFCHFNTHYDHMGQVARRQSSLLLMEKVKLIGKGNPVIISGDFNATAEDEPIKILTDKMNPLHFTDTRDLASIPAHGPDGTFSGWKINESGNPRIDYIYIRGDISVKKHATLSEIWGTRFSSDHFPVIATLVIN